jgi:hypothetical protein
MSESSSINDDAVSVPLCCVNRVHHFAFSVGLKVLYSNAV